MELKVVNSIDLFPSGHGKAFPRKLCLLVDSRPYQADVDIVISTLGDTRHIGALIENYLSLEKKLRVHIWVAIASLNIVQFMNVPRDPRVSKVIALNNPSDFLKFFRSWFSGSYSAALGAQLGQHLGSAPYLFYSHEDMMATKENFLSWLYSKLNDRTPLASFSQRGIIPFSGGMIVNKKCFSNERIDWLPLEENGFKFPGLEAFQEKIDNMNWVDAGEQFIYRALERGENVFVCESNGGTRKGPAEDPLDLFGVTEPDVRKAGINITYADKKFSADDIRKKRPDLEVPLTSCWRKSYDEEGDVIFIHRGRGTTHRVCSQGGDFADYLRDFNRRNNINSL
jgi:hypothetical protein